MDVKEFVAESLSQILEGVREAQRSDGGSDINAYNANSIPGGKNAFAAGQFGTFTLVEFDIAVSAETSGKGGANLKVFGVGIEGGGEHTAGKANRITFAIPVRLPDGDKERAEDINRRARAGSGSPQPPSDWSA